MPTNSLKSISFSDEPVEPAGISLDDIKAHLAISHNDLNSYLTNIVLPAARRRVEDRHNVSLVPRTITAVINNLKGNFRLPYGPVTAITSWHDYDGEEVLPTDYEIGSDGDGFPWLVSPLTDYAKIVYSAGYVTIPADLKMEVLQEIAWLMTERGDKERNGNPAQII